MSDERLLVELIFCLLDTLSPLSLNGSYLAAVRHRAMLL